MDSSSRGFNVLDRKTSLNSDFVRWMKSTDTGSKISIMAAHHHQTNPFSLGDGDSGAQTAGGVNDAGVFDYCTTPPGPGGGMAAGFPFTAAQWKELERQAMIYKCMISSVPVPPHLLFPPGYGGRYSRKGDPEPGRCKRTDGKKWRCSREVAPQQKYCERHLHRGRPRSRKPVEANNHKKTGLHQTKTPPAPPNHLLKSIPITNISTPYYNATNSLFKAGEIASSKQPWENLMVGFGQDYPLNLFSYPEIDLPTGFSGSDGATVEFESDLSPSLDLAMGVAVGNVSDQQMRNIHCECDDDFDPTNWLSPFGRGGPLGEALQPGSVAGSSPASPYSTPAATVSSPSGVLQRTLFSHSDGSVCNSPTVAAAISNNWHI